MWIKLILATVLALALVIAAVFAYGPYRWRAKTETLREELQAHESTTPGDRYDPAQLENLPPPVERYLRKVLDPGQRPLRSVRIRHRGEFNMAESGENWAPFTSRQWTIIDRPGFLWDARIRMLPGVPVHVHDGYVGGRGILEARLLGLIPVAGQEASPELAQGELMRHLAESPWYPTALLPGKRIEWEAIDDRSARATVQDGETSVTCTFHFGEDELVDRIRSEGRYRNVDGESVRTPWEGRFWAYEQRRGILVPTEGEVTWLLPEGRLPYWRASITELEYDVAAQSP